MADINQDQVIEYLSSLTVMDLVKLTRASRKNGASKQLRWP